MRGVRYVCSDMWQPYLKVIGRMLGQAVHVLDRFHVMKQFGKALDDIRAAEAKRLERDGYEPVLKRSRWCFLKRPGNLTDKQTVKLSELLKYNLRTMKPTCSASCLPAVLGVQELHDLGEAGFWMSGRVE